MNSILISEVANLGLNEVDLLALVTNTSYDVIFYANVDGRRIQSNAMAEEDLIDSAALQAFYEKIAKIIQTDASFDPNALNIVKIGRNCEVSASKKERNAHVYAIKKEWRNQVLNT